jgi:hypothetical protein
MKFVDKKRIHNKIWVKSVIVKAFTILFHSYQQLSKVENKWIKYQQCGE